MAASCGLFCMVFNGNTDNQDICSLADDMVSTTDNVFPLQQKARFANKSMSTIWQTIFKSYGGWQYDDSNQTNLPAATTSLVSGQQQYTIPTDAVSVRGLEVKTTGGSWQTLTPITEEQIRGYGLAEAEYLKVPGQPAHYRVMDGIVKLYPAANYSQTASLRMTFDRDMTQFTSTDTTKEPGFMSNFHYGVAIGMAMEFARAKRMEELNGLIQDWQVFLGSVSDYYSARWAEKFPNRITVRDAVRDFQ